MSDYIPQELVIQVLSWLPPKSLLRFRCVSKSWCNLISSPNFITMHTHKFTLSNHKIPTRIIVRHYSRVLKKEFYSVHFDDELFNMDEDIKLEPPLHSQTRFYFRIVGCCNGLICLSDDLFGCTNGIILWNPAIKRKLTLHLPHGTLENLGASMVALGFGFDTKTDDYKVVRITYILRGDSALAVPPEVELYSVKDREWRGINSPPPRYRIADFFWSQAFINGSVHWVAYCRSESSAFEGRTHQCSIMLFDMTDEIFKDMMLPESLVYELPMNMYASAFRGSLSISLYDKDCFCIWVMKEYNMVESWSKQFNICLEGGLGIVISVKKNGDVLVAESCGELIALNPVTGESVAIGLVGTRDSFYADTYTESLGLLVEGKRINGNNADDSESESSDEDVEHGDDVELSEEMVRRVTVQYLTALFDGR